jgi:hypothetical protein
MPSQSAPKLSLFFVTEVRFDSGAEAPENGSLEDIFIGGHQSPPLASADVPRKLSLSSAVTQTRPVLLCLDSPSTLSWPLK